LLVPSLGDYQIGVRKTVLTKLQTGICQAGWLKGGASHSEILLPPYVPL